MSGGTTRVQLHAIAGLASGHTSPFIRILHDDVIARHHQDRSHKTQAVVAVELPEDHVLPASIKRPYHVQREYTARWGADQSCIANLPLDVDWIEVQVWNRFADVVVFLGLTKISLRESKRMSSSAASKRNDGGQAHTMWYAMDPSSDVASTMRGAFNLTVQLSLSWHQLDERAMRIRKEILKRRKKGEDIHETEEGEVPLFVDPLFRFEEPTTRIEWSSVVAANVRRIFVQGDIDELQIFYDDVLHGDMGQEIEDDGDIVVDEGHLKAFRMCQLSAQYLDSCITLLESRKAEYTDLHDALKSTQRDRRRDHRDLLNQKRRLQKELGDLELLSSTYEKLLEHHGKLAIPVEKDATVHAANPAASRRLPSGFQEFGLSPPREVSDVVSKRPSFLMTWEEREQARKEQKELDKARRIEEEKLRLHGLFQERQHRESLDLRRSILLHRREERYARVLQAAFRSFLVARRIDRIRAYNVHASKIQAQVRCYLCARKWPQTRDVLRHAREQRLMLQSDHESAVARQRERDEWIKQEQLRQPQVSGILTDDEKSIGSPAGKPVEALELVAMWKKLKRILTLACEKGARPSAVFDKLDNRRDGVLDRAEFRLGVRYLGIRMNRKMTRAIISLARAKCDDPPKPLTLNEAQFVRGFDLPIEEAVNASTYAAVDDDAPPQVSRGRDVSKHLSKQTAGDSDDSESEGDAADREASQTIQEVAEAVANLRRRVLKAAQDHLTAKHKSVTDYFAFREALTHVFEEFDVDGNGELDVHELVECMAAINFRVTAENLVIVRECFVTDPNSDSVSISEFISFALAGMNAGSSTKKSADEELGILGYKLRDAILGRVKAARKQTDSIEDAVRLVFKGAYKTKGQGFCPRKDFARMLASLRLGFTPAQLSRLVLRLDQDGDNTISFDELLTWLRLRVGSEASYARVSELTKVSASRGTSHVMGYNIAHLIRNVFMELAGASDSTMKLKQQTDCMASLFQRIDRNDSKKINVSELEDFLEGVDLCELQVLSQQDTSGFASDATQLAKETVKLIDLNGNGVVTLQEWMGFMLESISSNPSDQRNERYTRIERVREAMRHGFVNETALLEWFHSIPGSISASKLGERKVRSRELKNAMRAKFSFLESKEVDEALKILDADGSEWVTEKELRQWQYPTRDIEELRSLITRAWMAERQSAKHKDVSNDAFVEMLYQRFDQDGNGLIARKEICDGFQTFRVILNDEESSLVVKEFDYDNDGFWSKADFMSCVDKLLPLQTHSRMEADDHQDADLYSSDSGDSNDEGGYDSPDPDHKGDHSDGEEDDYSLGEMSPPAMSPIQFDEDAVARSTTQRSAAVDYSEDFDSDG